ncbi:hypothetical protein DFP73DRAFT_347707 [Morchella snyderi]|nr:hypothetical protein DFP73DRAFT_347707 [Morchella snyderi]
MRPLLCSVCLCCSVLICWLSGCLWRFSCGTSFLRSVSSPPNTPSPPQALSPRYSARLLLAPPAHNPFTPHPLPTLHLRLLLSTCFLFTRAPPPPSPPAPPHPITPLTTDASTATVPALTSALQIPHAHTYIHIQTYDNLLHVSWPAVGV